MKFLIKPEAEYTYPVSALKKISCRKPFIWFEVLANGDVMHCCPPWLPKVFSNILVDSFERVVENLERTNLLNNIRNGDFSECNDYCHYLNSYLTSGTVEWPLVEKDNLDNLLDKEGYYVVFAYDRSCNLQCPSCRKELIVHRPTSSTDPLVIIHENVKKLIELLLSTSKEVTVVITGSGDPFASPLYWDYLLELSKKKLPDTFKIQLLTNGVMMTEQMWNSIPSLWGHISYISVSIDAASQEVYSVVRKNGNILKVKKNLEYLDSQILDKKFPNLKGWNSNFIVQSANFFEMEEFVRWQLEYKSLSHVELSLLAHWGHLSLNEFRSMYITDAGKLSAILVLPIFSDPRVKLGNLSSYLTHNSNQQ